MEVSYMENDPIFQWVYISESTESYGDEVLNDILLKANKKNEGLHISGVLVYNGGSFIQLLEGEQHMILKLYDQITHDKRHTNIKHIYEGYSQSRLFDKWTMAYKNIKEYNMDLRDKIEDLIFHLSKGDGLFEKDHVLETIRAIRFAY